MGDWVDKNLNPVEAVPPKPQPSFVFKEDKGSNKEVYLFYGNKGDGKTTAAFMFPGTIACLSFDRKSTMTKNMFVDNDRIKVYDCVELWDETIDNYTTSSKTSYDYIHFMIDNIGKDAPDYIVIDGLEIFAKIAEMTMRKNNGLKFNQGITNRNVWKERELLLRAVHNKAFSIAKKGLIYTTYTDKDEIIEEGEVTQKKDVPKWTGIAIWQTDTVIRVKNTYNKSNKRAMFTARVDNSKTSKFKTGTTLDITDKKCWSEIIEGLK